MLEEQLQRLNALDGSDVQYKILFLGRHGQGVHNVAEAQYATPAWDVGRVSEVLFTRLPAKEGSSANGLCLRETAR